MKDKEGLVVLEDGYRVYLFSYFHDGAWWSFSIPAKSEDDAKARLARLPLATYDGVLGGTIPAIPGGRMLAGLICRWKNFTAWAWRGI